MAARTLGVGEAVRRHWPEYLMEAWGLCTFMVSAGLIATALWSPASPVYPLIGSELVRRALMGTAMGLTAIAIIYSPWGKQSGAHINPAVTLTFLRLGKVTPVDAAFYILAQFVGGAVGVLIVWGLVGGAFARPPVSFINTVPGAHGAALAFVVEVAMAFLMMFMVLNTITRPRLMPFVGVFAGILVANYITFLAPYSGFSINPARTFASALPSRLWSFLWLYFTAPVFGMLVAVEVHRMTNRAAGWFCAKLNHDDAYRCIHCGYAPGHARGAAAKLGTATPAVRQQSFEG